MAVKDAKWVLKEVIGPVLAFLGWLILAFAGLFLVCSVPTVWWPPTLTEDDPRAELPLQIVAGTDGPLYVGGDQRSFGTIPFVAEDNLPTEHEKLRVATLPEIRRVLHSRVAGYPPAGNSVLWVEVEERDGEVSVAVEYDHPRWERFGLVSRYRLEGGQPKYLQRTYLDRSPAWERQRQPSSVFVIGTGLGLVVVGFIVRASIARRKQRDD